MSYELPFDKFLLKIKNTEMKKALKSLKLPDDAFFGSPTWKTGKTVKFNIDAKCSEANMAYLEKKLGIKPVGLNIDLVRDGVVVRFIKSGKKSFGSRNALGKALADAGELVTIKSLTMEIKTPSDTGEKIFIDDVAAFEAWMNTFKYTKDAVIDIVGNLSSFDILHDATDRTKFKKTIDAFCKKIKLAKDSWNPADIFIIKSNKRDFIISELENLVENYSVQDGLVDMFNKKIYEFYEEQWLYPISLKQLKSSVPSIEHSNNPSKVKINDYKVEIENFNLSLSREGKEIGVFTFKNIDTSKNISMQIRGFPHGYGIAQTEITSDGTPTGGRVGKISTKIVDRVLEEMNFERINSIGYFGRAPNAFSAFDDRRTHEVYSWYATVIKHPKVVDKNPLTFEEFEKLVAEAKQNFDVAENLCQKIQGLKMMYFFVINEDRISSIMNKLINGAKKISSDNGFFIKIY